MLTKHTFLMILILTGTLVFYIFPAQNTLFAYVVSDTIYVAPPTGEQETDRASILAALEIVNPGGIVQFAPGTYHIGQVVRSEIPRLTLLGHPEGTVLRGCDPAVFEDLVAHVAEVIALYEQGGRPEPPNTDICGILQLFEGGQTVRDLTFEHSWWGLMLGWHNAHDGDRKPSTQGGHRIEGNTFRHSANGVRATSSSPTVSVIRDNDFVNLRFGVSVLGSGVHLLDNDFTVPEPERLLPQDGDVAIRFASEWYPDLTSCEDNVIDGNRITGYAGGIALYSDPGTSCRNNVIRRNTIELRQVDTVSSDPGLPISLDAYMAEDAGTGTSDGLVAGTLVESNRVIRAYGPGIVVSRGSVRNQILDNRFDDGVSPAIVLEGDSNEVELNNTDDKVRDLGAGNRLIISIENKEFENIEPRTTLKDSIVSVTRELASAWIGLNPEEYLSYFSDDLIFYFQGSRFDRDEFGLIVRETMKSLRESTFEVLNPEVVALGPDAASISFELNEVLVDKSGTVTELWGMLTLIYHRRGGEWLVVSAHESLRNGK